MDAILWLFCGAIIGIIFVVMLIVRIIFNWLDGKQ